jgi:hypothetical protein
MAPPVRMTLSRIVLAFCSAALCFSCKQVDEAQANAAKTLFTKLSSDSTGVKFINHIEDRADFNVFKYRNFYNGGGVAVGDINNDGLPDIFFTANMQKNHLFLNKGSYG